MRHLLVRATSLRAANIPHRRSLHRRSFVDPSSLLSAATASLTIDFEHDEPESLHDLALPFEFTATRTALCHGLAAWFDVSFPGADAVSVLTTAPGSPATHWYQCRLLLREPLAVNVGQRVAGELRMRANAKYSYDLTLAMRLVGSEATTADGRPVQAAAEINLADQYYSYLTPAAAPAPAATG
jgi:histone-arginine methyltransferase CARM1